MKLIVCLIGVSLVALLVSLVLHHGVAYDFKVSREFRALTAAAMYFFMLCILVLVLVLFIVLFIQKYS